MPVQAGVVMSALPPLSAYADAEQAPVFDTPTYVRGMERLLRASRDLALARTQDDVQRIVSNAARELAGSDGAAFVLRDDGQCHYVDEDAIAPLWKGHAFPIENCISGWSMLNRRPASIPDIYLDARVPHDAYRPTFVKSLLMVPIGAADPVGAIGNYWAQPRKPSDEEESLLLQLAELTAIAMENVQVCSELERFVRERTAALEKAHAEMRILAISDEPTGLYNRRGFYVLGDHALKNARRLRGRCLLAMIDVEGLKRVNGELGHEVGDALIADCAHVLKATLRQSDLVARIGGDIFCALSIEPDGDAIGMRTRLAEAFAAFNRRSWAKYRLSASVGIVQAQADESCTLDRLLGEAERLMTAEKKARPERETYA
jgi:diguanylate cyclase (GGDEF)-like protein